MANAGPVPLTDAVVQVKLASAGLTFGDGTLNVPPIAPYATVQVPLVVTAAPGLQQQAMVEFDIEAQSPTRARPA